MIPDSAVLEGLLERVRAAKGADIRIDSSLWFTVDPSATPDLQSLVQDSYVAAGFSDDCVKRSPVMIPRFTGSIDAAVTLVERVLPGAVWHVMTDYGGLRRAKIGPQGRPSASVYDCEERPLFTQADAETPPLALCAALLTALLAQTTP